MTVEALVPTLESARSAIAKAEADLEEALSQVQAAPRAQKVRISEVLEVAFAELRDAKGKLARLEALIVKGKDGE